MELQISEIKDIIKNKKVKVIGFWIEPTESDTAILEAIEKVPTIKGVVFAKDEFEKSEYLPTLGEAVISKESVLIEEPMQILFIVDFAPPEWA